MERLTKRELLAGHYVAFVSDEDCFDMWSVPKKFMGNAIDRLAAIEDILGDTYDLDRLRGILNICNGKTPNQVERIFAEWSHYLDFVGKMNAIEDAVDAIYDDGNVNYDRLRELVEADSGGRLAILSEPMKPMVYKPNDTDVYCPKCGNTLSGGWELSDADDGRKIVQCPKCGQAIDDTKCEPAAEAALAKEAHP